MNNIVEEIYRNSTVGDLDHYRLIVAFPLFSELSGIIKDMYVLTNHYNASPALPNADSLSSAPGPLTTFFCTCEHHRMTLHYYHRLSNLLNKL